MNRIRSVLENHGIICFPTETVYALACMANSEIAIEKIYKIKQRNSNLRLSVMLADMKDIPLLAIISKKQKALIDYLLPGPTTVVLNMQPNSKLPTKFFKNTIGIRIPSHPGALKILNQANYPLAATSTNISGYPPAKNHFDISEEIKNHIDLIFIDDSLTSGVSSTVIDFTTENPHILRAGKVQSCNISSAILNTM